jgi:hypothetical protein
LKSSSLGSNVDSHPVPVALGEVDVKEILHDWIFAPSGNFYRAGVLQSRLVAAYFTRPASWTWRNADRVRLLGNCA